MPFPVKQLRGSEAGIVGCHATRTLAEGKTKQIIRTAGVSDHLALQSELIRLGLDDKIVSFTGSSGENENPDKYAPLLEPALKDADYFIIADNDETGRKGAKKWARFGFQCGARTRIVELPEEVDSKPIKDFREIIIANQTFDDLKQLMDAAPVLTENDFPPPDEPKAGAQAATAVLPGEKEPVSEKYVFDKDRTTPTAKAFLQENYTNQSGERVLHFVDGEFWEHSKNCYSPVDNHEIRKKVYDFLDSALVSRSFGGTTTYEPFPANNKTVDAAVDAVRSDAFRSIDVNATTWLGEGPAPVADPSMIIFGKTKNLVIDTMKTFPASPLWFNCNSLNFDFDGINDSWSDTCPQWSNFMAQLFGDDVDAFATLMEFIGLLLTPITKFQKAMFIVGPKRSGKGTIGRVIGKLVGERNCCSPTTDGLADNFGLQPFVGKTVAIISDARFAGNNGRLTSSIEKILNIVGEDKVLVNRKFRDAVGHRLNTRFVFLSNEIPRLPDASGAVSSRFIILKLTKSFFEKEDLDLEKKLEAELPGILSMAIHYLKELLRKGYFVQPESSKEEVEMMLALSSPVSKFVKECCVIEPGRWTATEDIWKAWKKWCEDEENMNPGKRQSFCQNLASAIQGISQVRKGTTTSERVRGYSGIALKGNLGF